MTTRPNAVLAPPWLKGLAAIIRKLPRARYPVANWVGRIVQMPPFVAEYPPGAPTKLRFWCDLRNSLAREVFFMGTYEPQETMLISRLLAPGQTFVDVGAHWGYFSLLAAEKVGPRGRVVAIEADPRIFDILQRSVALNTFANLSPVFVAASDREGEMVLQGFSESDDNWGISSVAGPAQGREFTVHAEPLDRVLDRLGVGTVDLLKMDIEGAEWLALQGVRAGLGANRYRRILLEVHPIQLRSLGSSAEQVLQFLRSFGYRAWTIDHSPATNRTVAYGQVRGVERLMRPLQSDVLDAWPHLLLTRDHSALPVGREASR
jgi:FkbM family methyltransferase